MSIKRKNIGQSLNSSRLQTVLPSLLGRVGERLLLAVLLLLTACSGDNSIGGLVVPDPVGSDSRLVVYIGMVPNKSRAVFASDPGITAESNINNATIGVFSSDGMVKLIRDVVPVNQKIELTVPNLATGDSVFLAINTPAGHFASITQRRQFKERSITIDEALGGNTENANQPNVTNTPMFGQAAVSASTEAPGVFTATVPVNHLLAKITLSSIKAELQGDATFTPTQVFLKDVPARLRIHPATSALVADYRFYDNSSDLFYQGEEGNNENYKAFLGTGANYDGTLPVFFYTMPNTAVTPTMLVLKGLYKRNGDTVEREVYYSMYINRNSNTPEVPNGGKMSEIYPNYNYRINVIVKNEGSPVPMPSGDDVVSYFIRVDEDYAFGTLPGFYANYSENIEQTETASSGNSATLTPTPDDSTPHSEEQHNGSNPGAGATTTPNDPNAQADNTGNTSDITVEPDEGEPTTESQSHGSSPGAGATTTPNSTNAQDNTTGNSVDTEIIPDAGISTTEEQNHGSSPDSGILPSPNGINSQDNTTGNSSETVINPAASTPTVEDQNHGSGAGTGATPTPNGSNSQDNQSGNNSGLAVTPSTSSESTEEYNY
ncbi:MAG: hypothetical protein E7104_00385 [Prevotella sp.]|nr:hypothetical protein [Prevotella sp.]